MRTSTSSKKEKYYIWTRKQKAVRAGSILFWIGVWQVAAMALNQEILLVSPLGVLVRIWQLMGQAEYWRIIGNSLLRIQGGFFLACLLGCSLAAIGGVRPWVKALLAPLVTAMKSVPVASFTILLLLWVRSWGLSPAISFLMTFPIVYTNLLQGMEGLDEKLAEMGRIFRIPLGRRLRYIVLPQLMPYLRAACRLGVGMAWKAGAAAEVIGRPRGSIGEALYESKIYLNGADLFAWTLTVVLLSLAVEKLLLLALGWMEEGMKSWRK